MPETNKRSPESSSSTTPLLRSNASVASYSAISSSTRPTISRALTTMNIPATTPPATPTFSRPIPTRAASANQAVRQTNDKKAATTRPSLLKRISSHFDATLELSRQTTRTPKRPSHWTDHAHRAALVKTWDLFREEAAKSISKDPPTVRVQLADVEKAMLLQFPELGTGDLVLGRVWMEYVLGMALRHPFCAEGSMGRWEVLSGPAKMGGMGAWGA